MIRARTHASRSCAALLVLGLAVACTSDEGPAGRLDARVHTHVVLPSTPSAAGLAYVEAVADVHARADAASAVVQIAILRSGLALPVPRDFGEAEILRLELATRLAEVLVDEPEGVAVALEVLAPMLRPERSLPLDRASARALVTLGAAAAKAGDDALAAGSYARAIRVMSLLRQELES